MSTIRAENDGLREVIYAALADHGELEHLYTIRWKARQNVKAIKIRLPVFQEERFSAEAWRNRNETGVSAVNVDQELTEIRFGTAEG